MNILFTICGRAGSKGIKNKNIRNFLGYPLPYYTLSSIVLYQKNNPENNIDIVLNTDSLELIKLFNKNELGKTEIIHREKGLGLDDTPKVSVIKNCYTVMKKRMQKDYDMVVDLDITAPLRTVKDIENLINEKHSGDYDVVFSVTDSRRNPYFNMVKKAGDSYTRVIDSEYNTRQEAPKIYDMNASMYAYSTAFLQTDKNIFEGKCGVIKMYDTAILDLDHENDFELMEVIAKFLYSKKNLEFYKIREQIENRQKPS